MPIVACVQLNGSSNIERNLSVTENLVRRAAAAGAQFVATPEATTYLGPHDKKVQLAEELMAPLMNASVNSRLNSASPYVGSGRALSSSRRNTASKGLEHQSFVWPGR